jgi:hypothetical protein
LKLLQVIMSKRTPVLNIAIATVCITALGQQATIAQANESIDLYTLCSNFPHNSRCKGYTAPIALDKRPGVSGVCTVKIPEANHKADCKITLGEKQITLYQEIGNPLSVLENKRDTQTIVIPAEQIGNLSFRTFVDQNIGGKVLSALLFGVSAASTFAPDKQMAEISFNYGAPVSDKAADKVSDQAADQTAPSTNPSEAKLVLRQTLGYELRTQLERMTGQTIESPELSAAKESFTAPSTPATNAKTEIRDLPSAQP